MKRSGPPKRKTPMKRGAPLKRKQPRKSREIPLQADKLWVKEPKKKSPKRDRNRIPQGVRNEVERRSRGLCETAGFANDCSGLANHMHHVLPKGKGGPNTAENLLHICGGPYGGHGGCHGAIHVGRRAEAIKRGYIV